MNALMSCNILVAMAPLKCDMDLKENTIHIYENSHFQRVQLIDSISERWKFINKKNYENATNFVILTNFYQEIIFNWEKSLAMMTEIPYYILSQYMVQ